MKLITKSEIEPNSLKEWKEKTRKYKRGTATWKTFGNPDKTNFKEELKKEQGYICCYCEQKLDREDSHIEHFIPQKLDVFSEYLFDYNNLLCSCQENLKEGTPKHCGNSKGSNDASKLVSPLDSECEEQFIHHNNGIIEGVTEKAKHTITILQLNLEQLSDLRASILEPFIIDPITFDKITEEEAKKLAKKYLRKKSDGSYNEFYTTVKYLYG